MQAFLDFDGSEEAWSRYDKITAREVRASATQRGKVLTNRRVISLLSSYAAPSSLNALRSHLSNPSLAAFLPFFVFPFGVSSRHKLNSNKPRFEISFATTNKHARYMSLRMLGLVDRLIDFLTLANCDNLARGLHTWVRVLPIAAIDTCSAAHRQGTLLYCITIVFSQDMLFFSLSFSIPPLHSCRAMMFSLSLSAFPPSWGFLSFVRRIPRTDVAGAAHVSRGRLQRSGGAKLFPVLRARAPGEHPVPEVINCPCVRGGNKLVL